MLLEKKNLQKELLNKRRKSSTDDSIMAEVRAILDQNETNRQQVKASIFEKSSTTSNNFDINLLETDRIFHISTIKSICIDYRLRFLGTHLFKGEIPEEAISKISHLEKEHHTKLGGFKIAAPSKLFHLKNYDDPLLFAPIGNGYFYLIHKWGNDMHPLRKWMMLPFKTIGNFIWLIIAVSFLLTAIVPQGVMGNEATEGVLRLVSFLFILKSVIAIALYYCFWKGKNFNCEIWNSEYYN